MFVDNRIALDDFDTYRRAWTAPGVCARNNCYNYVAGCRTGTRAQPGGPQDGLEQTYSANAVIAAAERDGLKRVDSSGSLQSTDRNRVAALFIAKRNDDFHWALKHPDGTWSHKRGNLAPEHADADGKPITDPRRANMHYKELGRGPWDYDYLATMTIPANVWVD